MNFAVTYFVFNNLCVCVCVCVNKGNNNLYTYNE